MLPNRYEIRQQDLVSCELYMAYLDGWNGRETRESVAFWKVHYQKPGEEEGWYNMELILDMEYHKIYDITVKAQDINEAVQDYEARRSKGYKNIMKNYQEESWVYLEQLFHVYYELDSNDYMYMIGVNDNDALYDAEAASVSGQVTGEPNAYESEKVSRQIIYQLKGALYFDQDKSEAVYHLPVVKEYG